MHINPDDSPNKKDTDKDHKEKLPFEEESLRGQEQKEPQYRDQKDRTLIIIEKALRMAKYDWATLNKKLASHIRVAMVYAECTTEKLAQTLGISEEALHAYLDPHSEHEIGTFFLDAREHLHISDKELFEGIPSSYYEEANDALQFILSCLDGSTVIRHLDTKPGVDFSRHFAQKIEEHIRSIAQEHIFRTRQELASYLDRVWKLDEHEFSANDLLQCIDESDFFSFLKTSAKRYEEMAYLLNSCIDANPLEFVPLKKIDTFDQIEISKRLERHQAHPRASEESRESYIATTEWSPEDTETPSWQESSEDQHFTESETEKITLSVAIAIGRYMPELIDGELPWDAQNQSV